MEASPSPVFPTDRETERIVFGSEEKRVSVSRHLDSGLGTLKNKGKVLNSDLTFTKNSLLSS